MKFLLSHPTGNRNVRAVLSSFLANESLVEFDTTIAVNSKSRILGLLPGNIRTELLRRCFGIDHHLLHSSPLREMVRMVSPKLRLAGVTRHETGWASVDKVYRAFDKSVAKRLSYLSKKRGLTSVYAYEDGALTTFRMAKELGIHCVYDLPIAYWETKKRLLEQEIDRLPQWKKTLGGGITDSTIKLQRKTEELELADAVISPSTFVTDSLPAWINKKRVILSPFGSPESEIITAQDFLKYTDTKRPLRILFAGSMGQRKGLADLFSAMKMIKSRNVELVVMGSLLESMDFYRQEYKDFLFETGRPHREVLALMRTCDVFCLPSIAEGRALVMQEAMSQGLPLIITPNTGGEDLIVEGKTGFLVKPGDAQAIAEKIDWFATNRDQIQDMRIHVKEHVSNYTWDQYGQRIISGLTQLLT